MNDAELLPRLIGLHDRIRAATRAALAAGSLSTGGDPAAGEARIAGEGAADVTYGIDLPAEAEVESFARELGRERPLVLISEGSGETRPGGSPTAGAESLRLIVDPIDGTRNLAYDLRSAWILTAVARDRGPATTSRDIFLAVQSEIPTRDSRSYHLLSATRGGGARLSRRDLATGELLEERTLAPSADARLDNGFYVFFKFSPEERVALAQLEERFLCRVVAEHGVDRRTLCDDQYISNGGQLFLMMTQRYRFLADLRGLVGDRLGLQNFTSKPYDVCCALIAEEAGIPITDGAGQPLEVPLDATSRVSFVAYANPRVRTLLEPLLLEALAELPRQDGR